MVTTRSTLFFSAVASALLTVAIPVSGQQSDDVMKDVALIKNAVAESDTAAKRQESLLSENDVSDERILARFMIRVYQTFVSSQQHNVCVFTPSCSHFGMESVERCGFIRGFLLTADRLTRCNTFVARGGYAFDPPTGKFIDCVAAYCCDSIGAASCPSPGARVLP